MIKGLRYIAVLLLFCSLSAYSQDTKGTEDKITSTNIIPLVITDTHLGSIIQYYQGVDMKYLYVPSEFFISGKAVRVYMDSSDLTPQINVIFKNEKAFRMKIYMPRNASSLTYRYKDVLTDEEIEKFKTKEILVDFF
jgi:hypothetical protein